ncbi:MAG: hypothetical protein GY842_03625 [bacterium]|nr:hypothetical protein [bacterium]
MEPVYFPPPPAAAHAVHLLSFNQLTDLVAPKRNWLDMFRSIASSSHVQTPAGIAYRGGILYVCDTGTNVVQRWNLQTGRGDSLGAQSKPALLKPVDVAVDESGTVYVADTGLARVVAFSPTGAVLSEFRPAGRDAYRPVAVAVRGERLYVTDLKTHQIDVFATNNGRLADSFGGAGDGPSRFFFPMGLAVADNGRVCVADMMNARVLTFDAQLQLIRSFGQPGDRYGDMGKPKRLSIGPDGVLFVADMGFGRVHLFDEQGRLLMLIGCDGDGPATMPLLSGVAVAPTLPPALADLVPPGFSPDYFLFVSNTVGPRRISLYAIGTAP